LKAITDYLDEPPVLLLDDVLAELDLSRQSLLMSVVGKEMQTIITTTHVTGFKPEWLEGASFLEVDNGSVRLSDKLPSLN
jgi:DNA replication and repair protein RecF